MEKSKQITGPEVEEIINNIRLNPIDKKSNYVVDITHIINPHQFYTRLSKHRAAVKKINNLKPSLLPFSVKVHDIILFNLKRNSNKPKYARGKVSHVEQAENTIKCIVYAIDYGFCRKNVPLDQILECDELLKSIPPLAMTCQLANCGPRGVVWGTAVQAFKDYVGHEPAKMIVEDKTPNSLIVTLYNKCPDDLATLLLLTDFTTFGYVHNDFNLIQTPKPEKSVAYYKFNKLKNKDKLHVRVLSGKSLDAFYVAEVSEYRNYLDNLDFFTQLSKKESTIDESCLKCGDLVGVDDLWDKIYKRGIVKEVYSKTRKALVHLVDLGKEEVLGIGTLKQIPQQYLSMPVVGIFCSVEDSDSWSNLHILLHPGREFLISIIKPGNGFKSANIVKINEILP